VEQDLVLEELKAENLELRKELDELALLPPKRPGYKIDNKRKKVLYIIMAFVQYVQ